MSMAKASSLDKNEIQSLNPFTNMWSTHFGERKTVVSGILTISACVLRTYQIRGCLHEKTHQDDYLIPYRVYMMPA